MKLKNKFLQIAAASLLSLSAFSVQADISNPTLGEITMFAGDFAPRGWAKCDGQLLPISQYQALFSILGTRYGGDGRTTFGLPDLRGRVAKHAGNGPGLTPLRQGVKGGFETVQLNNSNLPSIQIPATNVTGGTSTSVVTDFTSTDGAARSGTGATTSVVSNITKGTVSGGGTVPARTVGGGSIPFSISDPYQSVNYIISLTGTYPSRS